MCGLIMEKQVLSQYADYYGHMKRYRDELAYALENEREKRQALLDSNMDRLEAVLQLQQAETMKLRTMEGKRVQLQAELGSQASTASEFVKQITDESSKAAFSELIIEMTQLAESIKKQNALALEIAKTNLKLLEKIFNGGFEQGKAVYGPEGERRPEGGSHSLELKF